MENKKTEQVNSPDHYNQYPVEVIDMMLKVFGIEATYHFCILNAFKYRMRMGLKPTTTALKDSQKEKWYLDMAKVYEKPELVIDKKENETVEGTCIQNHYVVVQWPFVQEMMDMSWFKECILINDVEGLEKYGVSAYFVPVMRYKQFHKQN